MRENVKATATETKANDPIGGKGASEEDKEGNGRTRGEDVLVGHRKRKRKKKRREGCLIRR